MRPPENANRPPGGKSRQAAASSVDIGKGNNGDTEHSPPAPVRQYRCAGCGIAGRLNLADPAPDDQRPVLCLAPKGQPRLLCERCRGDAP